MKKSGADLRGLVYLFEEHVANRATDSAGVNFVALSQDCLQVLNGISRPVRALVFIYLTIVYMIGLLLGKDSVRKLTQLSRRIPLVSSVHKLVYTWIDFFVYDAEIKRTIGVRDGSQF